MTNKVYWRDSIDDLRNRAQMVAAPSSQSLSARTAARCLSGVVSVMTRRWSVDLMQRTCAELVRHDEAWATQLGRLPHENGLVSEAMQLLAAIARGILPLAGEDNLRAALSFWATETDPRVWLSIAEG